jgi:hypothetical protein
MNARAKGVTIGGRRNLPVWKEAERATTVAVDDRPVALDSGWRADLVRRMAFAAEQVGRIEVKDDDRK